MVDADLVAEDHRICGYGLLPAAEAIVRVVFGTHTRTPFTHGPPSLAGILLPLLSISQAYLSAKYCRHFLWLY